MLSHENINDQLYLAITEGNAHAVNEALANGADVNYQLTQAFATPLTYAMSLPVTRPEIIKALITNGASLQRHYPQVDTAWARFISLTKATDIIKSSAKVHQSFKDSVLLMAVCHRDIDAATTALKHGAQSTIATLKQAGYSRNAQELAILYKDTKMLELLLPKDSNFATLLYYEFTTKDHAALIDGLQEAYKLYLAIANDDARAVNEALKKGANVNYKINTIFLNPLAYAMSLPSPNQEIIKALIANGAKIPMYHSQVETSWPRLISVAKAIDIMSSAKVDQSFKDSVLLSAVHDKNTDAAARTLDLGANINATFEQAGSTYNAQELAVMNNDKQMLELLLARGSRLAKLTDYEAKNNFWEVIGGLKGAADFVQAHNQTVSQFLKDAVLIKAIQLRDSDIAYDMFAAGANLDTFKRDHHNACRELEISFNGLSAPLPSARCSSR
jgi:hypothetical protein